ncbi:MULTISPECIES: glycosyltransferase family 8 protein [Clostridia]|uniref:glycosyltransferase family 8 protein n=1 Tax=Clostridia TaxID=186801 RepID=UPI0005D3A683|nr:MULTISPECIES: glycosyltransferase family 8 protein [Clostridia]KJJ70736.1 general stress protein A [Clostridium sp. FS41]MCB7066604.1 glycosyltransferase family 8 protein [Enterocloster citroniae]
MNILYTCDNNYVWLMGISMLSLFENNKKADKIIVYLFSEHIAIDNQNRLKSIAYLYGRECIIIDLPELDIPKALCSLRWPKSAFSRLYSAELLPKEIYKILYIDCDTIILGSLAELWEMNVDEYTVFGVKDCIGLNYRRNIGLDTHSLYINAGVLLLNLEKLRMFRITALIDGFLKSYGNTIHYADQDILNGMFNGKFGILPSKYNVMTLEFMYNYTEIRAIRHPINYYSREEIKNAIEHPCITHFTTCMLNIRPWFRNSTHPLTNEFMHYKMMSPWKDKTLNVMHMDLGTKTRLLKLLHKLPLTLELNILGLLHSVIYPKMICLRAFLKNILRINQERIQE